MDANCGRRAVGFFVPLGGDGEQFAIAVASGDIGHQHMRQRAGPMQRLAPVFDPSFVGKFAQHMFEGRTVGILQSERACKLTGANLAGLPANEGNEFVFGREMRFDIGSCHE